MKFPKEIKTFCPHCRQHTIQVVEIAKKRKKSALSSGERRFARKMLGYGSFPKEHPKKREKPTRKVDLRFKCTNCGKYNVRGKGFRVKKLEFVKV